MTCQNVSMAQFGVWLPTIAGGYTQVPAIDMTGLDGGYDFTLDFSPIGLVQGPRPDAGNAPGTAALNPPERCRCSMRSVSSSGIRLEETKRPLPVPGDRFNQREADG